MATTTEKFTPDQVVMASKAGSSETANDCTPEDAAAAALQKTSRISSVLTVLVAGQRCVRALVRLVGLVRG